MPFRAVAALLASCFALACKGDPDTYEVPAGDPRLRFVGWFDERAPDAVRFAWPGSQIEVRFRGTGLRVRLTDTPVPDETRDTDWMAVVVDGGEPKTMALREGTHGYDLTAALPDGAHRVLLWKRTEAEVGVVTLHGFTVLGERAALLPPKPSRRRMVFIGDSITAGYGNQGVDGACHWSAKLEDNFHTFGAYAARAFGADYAAAAWSGKGLVRNYDPRDTSTLPQLWDRIIPTEAGSPAIKSDRADVVVVNVGTNDFFRGIPPEQAFVDAYRKLLASVRTRYPDSLIVLGLGPMLADDYPQPQARATARRWLERVRAEAAASGDTRTAVIEFWFDPEEGVGCDFHPNQKTHARMGSELVTLIRTQLAW